MSQRISAVAGELRKVIRLATRDPEALEGRLPTLSSPDRVTAADEIVILSTWIPQLNIRADAIDARVLAAIAGTVGEQRRRHLKVRLYDSSPSIAVYAVDDRAFVSVFLHGQLAFRSVEIEIEGQESLMGAVVFRELETLWKIGQQFEDVTQWQTELQDMACRFGISR